MKYVDEFRDGERARGLARALHAEADPGRHYRLMEFCGGHTHAVFRYGVPDLLPDNIELIHGPGCPVCVLPIGRLDMAIRLVEKHPEVILASYGDMLRVPGSGRRTLLQARADGADVRMVYSVSDALALARANPERQMVFFGIGFETTTPPTALGILEARRSGLENFSVFCNHVLTPAAMGAILDVPETSAETVDIDGFIGPSHVSVIIGSGAYRFCADAHHKPVVIAGFEPLDVLQSLLMLVRQLNEGRAEVENQYIRAVTPTGNERAQAIVDDVFTLRDSFEWRGLGQIPHSALGLSPDYAEFDAERRFDMAYVAAEGTKGCECPAVLRGAKKPVDCKLFATACTPENPLGSCMVSDEGACAAYFTYGRFRQDALERQQAQRQAHREAREQ
ncbi:hydrogenase formation protein HypD [Pseudohalioglobus sediminis]|uniref:Hydrogenase maturation factor n=1 Tax=Pseudohalioglobus sediminis TaxID=2606449 RepID=A0A5B0WU13_9GAMM|nr:hydrogenase formation protein HypD [Pseudohalioglobus sediminis]KAA1189681.1 hydrogenase formation protein HypD [Pseudohalioglobus sediminis]